MLTWLPASTLALAAYLAGIGVTGAGFLSASEPEVWSFTLFTAALISGAQVSVTTGLGLVLLAGLMACVAVARAAHSGTASLRPSIIAVIAFGLHVIVLIALPAAGTTTFVLLTAFALFEAVCVAVIGGSRSTPTTADRSHG